MRTSPFRGEPESNRNMHDTYSVIMVNPRLCAAFYSIQLVGGGGSVGPHSRSAPDSPRALRKKNERAARNKRVPMVSNFMDLGQPVTSEVRSNT